MCFEREENRSCLWKTAQRLQLNSHARLCSFPWLESQYLSLLSKRGGVMADLADVDVFIFGNVFQVVLCVQHLVKDSEEILKRGMGYELRAECPAKAPRAHIPNQRKLSRNALPDMTYKIDMIASTIE